MKASRLSGAWMHMVDTYPLKIQAGNVKKRCVTTPSKKSTFLSIERVNDFCDIQASSFWQVSEWIEVILSLGFL